MSVTMREAETVPVIHRIPRKFHVPCQLGTDLLAGVGVRLKGFEENGQPLLVHLVRFLAGVFAGDDEQVCGGARGGAGGRIRRAALECSLQRVETTSSVHCVLERRWTGICIWTTDGARTQCRSRSRGALNDAPHTQVDGVPVTSSPRPVANEGG